MILVDANLPLHAYDSTSSHHRAARAWWEQALSSPEQVRVAWVTVLAFLRIATNPRAQAQPLLMAEAAGIVEEWLARPQFDILPPGERHWSILNRLLRESQVRGPLLTDAHLAALAIEHGATLCSADRDFTRFAGLRWWNPLDPLSKPPS